MVDDKIKSKFEAYFDKIDIFSKNIYSHARNNEYVPDPYIGFKLKKLNKIIEKKTILKTNNLGLRAEDNFLNEKFDNVFLGGSFVYGAFSPSNETTLSSYYQTITGLKSLNAGIPGHLLKQHFSLFLNYLKKISFDKLIFVFGFNDMANCLNKKNYNDIKFDILHNKINRIINEPIKQGLKISIGGILEFLQIKQSTYNLLYNNKKKIKKINDYNNDISDYINDMITDIRYFNNLRISNKIYFFIQPTLITSQKKLSNYEQNVLDTRNLKMVEFCKNFHKILNDKIKDIKNIISLENVFDNEESTMFIDDVHVGDKGNKIISKKINEIIKNDN